MLHMHTVWFFQNNKKQMYLECWDIIKDDTYSFFILTNCLLNIVCTRVVVKITVIQVNSRTSQDQYKCEFWREQIQAKFKTKWIYEFFS